MALLLALSFAMVFFILYWNIRNKILVLFGFTTLVFNCYLFSKIVMSYDPYYAMFPIRWFFPILLFFWAAWYLRKPSKIRYYLSFLIFPAGILWNPEFGILTFLAMIIFYSFFELKKAKFILIVKGILRHIVFALLGVAIIFGLYALFIKLFYGGIPEFGKMFSTFRIFSVVSFNMLPMPTTFHPWMIIALVYLVGLLYFLSAIVRKNITPRSGLVLLLTIAGIGTFAYYQGRSHNWNLFTCSLPAFLLMTLFADDLYVLYKSKKLHAELFALVLFFLAFSVFQVVFDMKRISSLMKETENRNNAEPEERYIEKNARFIRENTVKGEEVFIFTGSLYPALYYDLSETSAVINPGFGDLFLRSDYDRILEGLKKNETAKVFLEPEHFQFYDQKIPVILSALYDIRSVNPDLWLLNKKTPVLRSDFIIDKDDGEIFHELLNGDLNKKLAYEMEGSKNSVFGDQYSVEIIFKPTLLPKSPLTNWATLLANGKDETGMMLSQYDTVASRYLFAVGGQGILLPVNPGKWNLLCVEYNKGLLRGFSNGAYIGSLTSKTPYQDNGEPFFIGNYKTFGRFFFGDIRELKITARLLNDKEISETEQKVLSMN